MLKAVGYRSILAELFVWTVIGIKPILAAGINPSFPCLYAEMVVALPGQLALAVGTLKDSLGKSHGSRYTMLPLLLYGKLGILFYIFA